MPRVSLIEENDHPELAEIFTKIRGNRGGRVRGFYKVMLHSPALALSWLEQAASIRSKTDLDGSMREIVVMRVAILNRDHYAFKTHVTEYADKVGLSQEQCNALNDWRNSDFFNEQQRADLGYTDAMTLDVQVSDDVYLDVQKRFTERQIVELTVLIGTYNMHTRVLQALRIES